MPSFMAEASPAEKAQFATAHELPGRWGHEVLTQGISTAFTAAVGMVVLALLTATLVVRVRKSDLEALSGRASAGGPAA